MRLQVKFGHKYRSIVPAFSPLLSALERIHLASEHRPQNTDIIMGAGSKLAIDLRTMVAEVMRWLTTFDPSRAQAELLDKGTILVMFCVVVILNILPVHVNQK